MNVALKEGKRRYGYYGVVKALLTLGIQPNLKGYYYLVEGVLLIKQNKLPLRNASKNLYPLIAKRLNESKPCIERDIRHAINVSCNLDKMKEINRIIGAQVIGRYDKPTCRQLLGLLAEVII